MTAMPLRGGQIRPEQAAWLVFGILLLAVPYIRFGGGGAFFDDPWLGVFILVAIYAMLGFGLNVVVGYAGMLDLGYVAFFAAGAYTTAILTAPATSADTEFSWWLVLPIALLVSVLAGILLGLPVLSLRGDYLAIVTLGFGEIIRLLLINLEDLTKGSQGISAIQGPVFGSVEIDDAKNWYYFAVVAAALVAFATVRLRDSGVGRAWEALREDEDVAASMGINTMRYKLMAFAVGAAIGGIGGALFASRIAYINPEVFTLQVSINVLAIVIIGGMGSLPGVILGAFILIGVPEILQFRETADLLEKFGWLRDILNTLVDGINKIPRVDVGKLPPSERWGTEIASKRFIIYGALLVAVMVLRPSGIFPSKRRALEFEQAREAAEDVA